MLVAVATTVFAGLVIMWAVARLLVKRILSRESRPSRSSSASRGLSDGSSSHVVIKGPPPSHSLLGNLDEVGSAGSLHEYLVALHKKYGSVASFYWMDKKVVSLSDPQHWRHIMKLFDRPPALFSLFEPMIGEGSIQYANGEEGKGT